VHAPLVIAFPGSQITGSQPF